MLKSLFAISLFLLSLTSLAQAPIIVTEGVSGIDGISRNALSVTIAGGNTEEVKKAWKKQLKDLKGKVKDKTIIFGDNCRSSEMGPNSFDIYSVIEEATGAGVKLIVAFDLGGAYLSRANHPDRYAAGEKIVHDFALEQTKEVVRTEIANAQKTLALFEKELVGMEKDKDGLERAIEEHLKKIEESKIAIEKNVAGQSQKQGEINGMKVNLTNLEIKLNSIR